MLMDLTQPSTNILHGKPQGFIMGQLLLNVFLFYLFLFLSNADLLSLSSDNTLFSMASSELEVINEFTSALERLSFWL